VQWAYWHFVSKAATKALMSATDIISKPNKGRNYTYGCIAYANLVYGQIRLNPNENMPLCGWAAQIAY